MTVEDVGYVVEHAREIRVQAGGMSYALMLHPEGLDVHLKDLEDLQV